MCKNMNQKEVWDKIAEQWHDYRKKTSQEVEEFAKGKKGRILEIACGNCRQLIPFKGCELYGIDFSPKMIEKANQFCKEHNIEVDLRVSEATALPFDNSFFDVVLFLYSLHNLKEEDRTKALQEMFRVMKPGGTGMVSVWLKEEKGDKEVYWGVSEDDAVYRYYHFFSKEELEQLIKENGFKITKSYTTGKKRKNIYIEVKKVEK